MYICYSWLRELANLEPDIDINDFVNRMTMTGTKVETVKHFGDKLSGIVTGKILEIKKHPSADKLVITKIDIGDKILQIVTGATNVFEGAVVPVATHNSNLFDGTKIKKSKLRGEISEGMLCSIQELGYNKTQYPEASDDGIYIFKDNNIELGCDVSEILELKGVMIDFEITSNRPDCMSVIGIARETAATFNKKLIYPDLSELGSAYSDDNFGVTEANFRVEVENKKLCTRYMAKVVNNVKIKSSPQWLRHRLILSGINPINNIVDITNYVMLETGQPLHAFDADSISGNRVIVRNATAGEKIKTLDGTERTLDDDMLVVADNKKVLALAGIIGGDNSKISGETRKILIEAAHFDGYNIRTSSKKLGLRTDASNRFEKNIDLNLVEFAMRRVVYLIKKLDCGEVSDFYFDSGVGNLNKRSTNKLLLDPDKINTLLGTNISVATMVNILNKLELSVENNVISIPSFRNDIKSDADVAEEVLRFYGYDKISSSLPANKTIGGLSRNQVLDNKIKNILVAHGAFEAKNFSFASYHACNRFLLDDLHEDKIIKILNPIGEEFSCVRNSGLNAILKNISFNFDQKNSDAILFELAKIYELNDIHDVDILPTEKKYLTIGSYGHKDFFDLKGIIESLFMNLKIREYKFEPGSIKFLHPFRQARILVGEDYIGYMGEYINYDDNKDYEIKTRVYLAVLDVNSIYNHVTDHIEFRHLPKFPAVTRDIALVVDKNIPSGDLVSDMSKFIRRSKTNSLEKIELFDVYEGEQIDKNKKSLAYKLVFRSEFKTLKEEEVNAVMAGIINLLKDKHGAELRQ